MELPLALGKSSEETLQAQIFEQIRRLILQGYLRPGMSLPPTRQLSEKVAVSRNTVTLAYDRLISEGYLEARGRAGTFVSRDLPSNLTGPEEASRKYLGAGDLRQQISSPLLCFAGYSPLHGRDARRPSLDFWVGRSDPSTFPVAIWRSIMLRKLSIAGSNLTEYGDPAGLPELRTAIANLVGRSRGMRVTAEQVIITSGSQDGLNLICRLVDRERIPFFIEDPCFQGAASLFQSIGSHLHPIPVDAHGLVVDQLPRDRGGLLFVTPSHQYPTGATLTLDRRIQLLRWAEATNSIIIEDDYDSDFRYNGPPLTALAGLDEGHRVLYLGTFSKSLGAGLRLGFAIVPANNAASARLLKSQMNQGQPWLEQAVLAEFLESGLYDRHLRRTRKLYKSKRDCLQACLEKNFGPVDISGADGGLHIVWRFPAGMPSADIIEQRALAKGVGVYTLHSGGAYSFDRNREGSVEGDSLVLGYSAMSEQDIERAVETLRVTVDELVNEAKLFSSQLPANSDA